VSDGSLRDEQSVARLERLAARLEEVVASAAEVSETARRASERYEKQGRRVERQAIRLEKLAEGSEARARGRRRRPPDWKRFDELAAQVLEEKRTLLGADRLYVLWQAARNAARLARPAVEVGTYRGGSARFLSSALAYHAGKAVDLHVFDTFAGHPAGSLSDQDSDFHTEGHFGDASLEDVSEYLDLPGLEVHAGDAVHELPGLRELKLSLAHLDVDLYRPTRACLDFVSDRLVVGGVIVVDDFGAPKCPGIVRAVGEFVAGRQDFQTWYPETEQAILVRTGRRPPRSSAGRKTGRTDTPG
jgi:hypothetical protein